jgi:hypothetical protein
MIAAALGLSIACQHAQAHLTNHSFRRTIRAIII